MHTEIKVKNFTLDVIFSDPAKEKRPEYDVTDCGETFFTESKIFINTTMKDDLVYSTIKHELTHAYLWAYGFNINKCDEEDICSFVETYAEDIINDAKKLFKEYVDNRKVSKKDE